MAIGIGQALLVGFLYWAAHSIAIAFGRGGALAARRRRLADERAVHELRSLFDAEVEILTLPVIADAVDGA